ncbi:HAD family hydrolase [Paenibacillus mendelii]|uniref:HAD family hydrolase n=1 Tax=Paenibacillus mendelii TaxID=206163 RepID=A0ABV6JFY6_9BACL|nr:HAD family hydrolase [Paenibacillus mendelii]MCQ6557671.1 HAD family hydrolase [Paenibacillus mendelii]
MRIEAVIFDLDNTLVNRREAFKVFTERFIDQFIVIKDEIHRIEVMEHIRIADQDGYRKKRELYEELRSSLELKNRETSVDELLTFWFDEFFKCTLLMEGAKEVLDYLRMRKIKLGLITNGSIRSQYSKIDQVMIREYFDSILVSDEVQVKKPDKRIFEMALNQLDAGARHTWYIGDHPINDIKGAREAGINAAWLKGFMEWDASVDAPKHVLNNLHELIDIVDDALGKSVNF